MGVCVGCMKRGESIKGAFMERGMWTWIREVLSVAVCWMPLEQVVGQINGAFNSGTSCRMSACCCSLPGEKCQYNVSGSDSVHNTSAVILLCNNVTFIFGK